jgi:hypothetical protein
LEFATRFADPKEIAEGNYLLCLPATSQVLNHALLVDEGSVLI